MSYFGMYRGICVANNDPEGLYRIKVQVPTVLGDEQVTDWAWPCVPPGWPYVLRNHEDAGNHLGGDHTHPGGTDSDGDAWGPTGTNVPSPHGHVHTEFASAPTTGHDHWAILPVPNPRDGVWVAFEAGDATKPLWLGVWLRRV